MALLRCALLLAISASNLASADFTNLPPQPPGLFKASARIELQTTRDSAWDTLTNFPTYAEWNPFVRSAIMVSPYNRTLPEQYPVENRRLYMRTQLPPLPLPVDEHTPDNPLHTSLTYENVTHVQPNLGRLAWAYAADELLEAERWQAISDVGNGTVLYESVEVYRGPFAGTLKALQEANLQEAFRAQAEGLKLLLEGETSS